MSRRAHHLHVSGPCVAALVVHLALACHVDERQLSASTSGGVTGGDSSAGGTGSRDCDNTADSSTAGRLSKSACSTGICPDLNENSIADNTETLVHNPTFEADFNSAGWDREFGVSQGWFHADACGKPDSGSMSLTSLYAGTTSPHAQNGARQCVSVEPGRSYSLTADVDPDGIALAGVALVFFSTENCAGDPLTGSSRSSKLVDSIGDWQTVAVTGAAPTGAQSVAVRLSVGARSIPPSGAGDALFDNVLFLAL
jgi:hypothetical protein